MALETDEAPAVGTPVTLLSQTSGRPYQATVAFWDGGEHGLVVRARLEVDPSVVSRLADHRVWVSASPPETGGGVTVYGGVAHPAGESAIDVTGVATILRDRRRRTARSEVDAEVTVRSDGRRPRNLRMIDLSRGGVRVALAKPADLTVGEHVTLDVSLDDGSDVPTSGQVLRVDQDAQHAVVRFDDLSSEQSTRIDRYVLLRLTPPD